MTTPKAHGDILPPHDLDAEQALLGSMLLDGETIGYVVPILPPAEGGWFYHIPHAKLYQVLAAMFDANRPVDLVTLKAELVRRNELEAIGGLEYLVQLAQSVPSAANAEHYASIVRDKALLRLLIVAAGEIQAAAYRAGQPAAEILDEAERQLFAVTEHRVSGQAREIAHLVADAFAAIEGRKAGLMRGVPTGLHRLDEMTHGLQGGDLVIVAARPSVGKSALALNIAEYLAVDEGKPVAFFSMEMSRQQLAERILCSRGRIDSHRLASGLLDVQQVDTLRQVLEELRSAPLLIDDSPGMTILELRAKARRLRAQQDVAAVCVDYLQLMRGPRTENRQQEVSEISRGLKAIARELGIPVICLAQLNRAVEGREGHRPRLSDLRESGSIEQDADVVILLHRASMYGAVGQDHVAEAIIAKHRNGPTGTVPLHFDPATMRFGNLADPAQPASEQAPSSPWWQDGAGIEANPAVPF